MLFNAVGGYCVLFYQDILMTMYVTGEPYHASVPCFRVHDLGGAEWSIYPVMVFPFGRVLTPPSLRRHLALTSTFVHHAMRESRVVQSTSKLLYIYEGLLHSW